MAISPIKELGYTENNGLVFCSDISKAKNNAERLYLSDVKNLKAHAVLFRRFYKEEEISRPYHSEPAVCIFKEEDVIFNSEGHIQLHAALWSEGKNEIYIIYGKNRIDIINARRPSELQNKKPNIEGLKLASDAIEKINKEKFSAYLFGQGTFWEQSEFKDQLTEKNSPHIHLLNYLMTVREKFLDSKNGIDLKPATIDKLLVVSILVKFLEEIRDGDNNQHTLHDIYKKYQVNSFVDAVRRGFLLNIFEDLANSFNGKIFDKFSSSEKSVINKTSLDLLAQFLEANIDIETQQLFFWEQYSFKHLPAEVISAIYENFIQTEAQRNTGRKEKGVVYTPIHLVNFLIDEVMPLDKADDLFENEIFRILDPSCGSGVFLVAAYKRLLQWWTIKNSSPDNILYPNSKVAQRILEENIFGVDVKETAVLVSIFGLTTALLNKLEPKEIWNNLKLKDPSKENIIQDNFFNWAGDFKEKNKTQYFDLVIGNPPFNPESKSDKKEVLEKNLLAKINFKHHNIPRNNFALHFFEGSMTLGKSICMIIPASIMLYDKAHIAKEYRKQVFTDFTVLDIYDFTHLREVLFTKKKYIGFLKQGNTGRTPVVALIAKNKPSERQIINHTVIKRVAYSEKKIRFEIDYYDRHKVPWKWAIDPDKQFVWKTNLLGGGRLYQLIYRLSLLPTLKNYIQTKRDWKEIRGFEGGSKVRLENKDRIISIKSNGIPKVDRNVTIKTNRLKDLFMYEPPFLIIDQVLGDENLLSCFVPAQNPFSYKSHLFYNRDFLGISAPNFDEKKLENIHNYIQHSNHKNHLNSQLYLLATSSSSLVLTETDINKSEILNIPYPTSEKNDYLHLSQEEKIIQYDTLNYYRHLGKAISKNSSGATLHEKVSKIQIENYGKTLCESLNSIYQKNSKSWQLGKIYQTPSFTACQIGFGKENGLKQQYVTHIGSSLEELITEIESNKGASYKKVVRIYNHQNGYDCVLFIKPNALRYWLRSIALRDADDTFADFKKEGF